MVTLKPGESVRVVELSERHAEFVSSETLRADRAERERDAAIREREQLRDSYRHCREVNASVCDERDKLTARVAELQAQTSTAGEGSCAAPAASGGGEGEGTFFGAGGPFNFQYAEDSFFPPNVHGFLRQCVKIKEAPPQPRGWLTPEQRSVLELVASDAETSSVRPRWRNVSRVIRDILASATDAQPRGWLSEEERELIAGIADDDEFTEDGQNIAKALLARSSPPEVVLPTVFSTSLLGDRLLVEAQVKEALAAAGVAVKEVG
jgi:hypothetical protein